MSNNNNKTFMLNKDEVKHDWLIFDATGKTLGRLASEIAKVLRGKHRPDYTPHVDCGDGVIVINANKVVVTGDKEAQKVYYDYSLYIGGQKKIPYLTMKQKKPGEIIKRAVFGMLPKSRLSHKIERRLRVFAGEEHGMEAQKPIKINI